MKKLYIRFSFIRLKSNDNGFFSLLLNFTFMENMENSYSLFKNIPPEYIFARHHSFILYNFMVNERVWFTLYIGLLFVESLCNSRKV